MSSNSYTDVLKLYREKMNEQGITRLSDADIEQVSGGVGGLDEATCPCCAGNVAMNKVDNPYGDAFWTCPTCGTNQYFSDAETIEIIRAMEAMNYPGIQYPVWWPMIQKNLR